MILCTEYTHNNSYPLDMSNVRLLQANWLCWGAPNLQTKYPHRSQFHSHLWQILPHHPQENSTSLSLNTNLISLGC